MNIGFVVRTEPKGRLEIAERIIEIRSIKADEQAIEDLRSVIALFKELGYTVDS